MDRYSLKLPTCTERSCNLDTTDLSGQVACSLSYKVYALVDGGLTGVCVCVCVLKRLCSSLRCAVYVQCKSVLAFELECS